MTLLGKGHYMWQIPKCDGGSPAAITARLVKSNASHVMIKIADGASWPYNIDPKTKVDWIPPVLVALKQAGLAVWGWQYVRGDYPEAEANLAVQRAVSLGIDGFVVDAEIEYKKAGKAGAARRYMTALRAGLGSMPIALSTYRFPRTHPDFPFAAFLEQCDLAMPQVYFEQAHNVEDQLERCVQQYLALQPARPIIPTGPTYSHGGWRPTAGEVERFLVRAKAMGLTAANFWAYDFSTRPSFHDLWDAIAAFDWPAGPPVTSSSPFRSGGGRLVLALGCTGVERGGASSCILRRRRRSSPMRRPVLGTADATTGAGSEHTSTRRWRPWYAPSTPRGTIDAHSRSVADERGSGGRRVIQSLPALVLRAAGTVT